MALSKMKLLLFKVLTIHLTSLLNEYSSNLSVSSVGVDPTDDDYHRIHLRDGGNDLSFCVASHCPFLVLPYDRIEYAEFVAALLTMRVGEKADFPSPSLKRRVLLQRIEVSDTFIAHISLLIANIIILAIWSGRSVVA